jgi:hypothetical protein
MLGLTALYTVAATPLCERAIPTRKRHSTIQKQSADEKRPMSYKISCHLHFWSDYPEAEFNRLVDDTSADLAMGRADA